MCRIEDGVFYISVLTMKMFHRDPLKRRVSEIIDRLYEKVTYSHWNSRNFEYHKSHSRKIGIVHPLDEYYSFNLYHMQPAFCLLLMGWCVSAFCFIAEVLYYIVLRQTNLIFECVEFYFNLRMAVVIQDYVDNLKTASPARFQRVK